MQFYGEKCTVNANESLTTEKDLPNSPLFSSSQLPHRKTKMSKEVKPNHKWSLEMLLGLMQE